MYKIILTICFLAIGIRAEKCPTFTCPSTSTNYHTGNVYFYKFDSNYQILTTPEIPSDSEETNGKVSGTAKIFSKGDCNFAIQLENVYVISPKDNLKRPLTGHEIPLKFGIRGNGDLEHQICADTSDDDYALNLKRSIISMFSTGENKIETDVFGVCSVDKIVSSGKQITKKDLSQCSHRENFGLIKGVVDEYSGIKSTPLLSGTYVRESEFNEDKTLKTVNVNEAYRFGDKKKTLVSVKVSTHLEFDKFLTEPSPKVGNGRIASIIFESPKRLDVKNGDVLKKQFKKTLDNFDEFIKFGSTEYFVELLRLMRHANTESLMDLSALAGSGLARKIYFDALFRTGTSKAISAILRQVPKMDEREKKLAYLSFYLVEDVTKENLNQAANLLTNAAPKESYLALGHLVSRFCSKNNLACDQSSLSHVTKKFIESLKKCRAQTKSDEDRILFTLKGIQNSQKVASSIVPNLIQCSNVSSNRIRVAAIQAFAVASCNTEIQEKTFNILSNLHEDSEIRIESYLAAINCPSNELASKIEKLVNNEPVNQVGNFIATHLRALKESTDRSRANQKYFLENIRITKKFEMDWRRFSFASDNSFLIESLGLGASCESNIIYGLDGYLPRSMRWNVSAELFGNEMNILDLSMRQENMEKVVEGLLSTAERSRFKRGLREESEKFSKKYKPRNPDISLDVSLKFFGSEMFFLSLDSFESFDMKKILTGLVQENKVEVHTLFLDTKIIYPTSLGFPLELSANGMSANKISFDFRKKDNSWFLKLIPSFDATVSARISIDFQNFKNGLKVSSVLHSATGFEAELNIDKDIIENVSSIMTNMNTVVGNWTQRLNKRSTNKSPNEKFSLNLHIPRQSSNIIKFKHSVAFVHSELDKEEKVTILKAKKKRNSQEQCFEQLLIFGAKVCYHADFTDFDYADFSLKLDLEEKITFVGSHITDKNKQSLVLIYDTPESKNQHTAKITASFALVPEFLVRVEVELANINKLLALEIGMKNNDKETIVYFKHSDDSQLTNYQAGITKSSNEYYPLLEVHSNGHKVSSIAGYSVSGKIVLIGNTYSLENIEFVTPSNEKAKINGKLSIEKDKFSADLSLNNKMSIKGALDISGEPAYKIELFIDENGGQIIFAPGEGSALIKFGEKDVRVTGKYEKEQIDVKLSWSEKNKKEGEIILNCKKTSNLFELIFSFEKNGGKSAGLTFKIDGEREFRGRTYLNRHFIDIKGKREGKQISGQLKTSLGTDIILSGSVNEKFSPHDHLLDVQGKIQLSQKDTETNWQLKSSANNDKYSSDFKVSRDNIEWFSWSSDVSLSTDKPANGKVNLKLKDLLSSIINFKFNSKNGRGESSALINIHSIPDSIKGDVKFVYLLPKFEMESAISFGNERKYSVKSENVLDKSKLHSKSILSWNKTEKEVQIEINGNIKADELQGELGLLINGNKITGLLSKKHNKNGIDVSVSLKEGENTMNIKGKIEKAGKNVKANINVNSQHLKLEAGIQKTDSAYSYVFDSGNIHTSASLSPYEISFNCNELQVKCNRDTNSTSFKIKHSDFFLNGEISISEDKLSYKQDSSVDKIRALAIIINKTQQSKVAYSIINGRKYGIELNHGNDKIELLLSTPEKSSKILAKANINNERKSAEWLFEVIDFFNFDGKHTGSYDLEDLQNLHIGAIFELKKKVIYQVEITSQQEKFNINIVGEKGNLVKGSLNYAIKKESHKSYVEGQGQLLVGEKTTQANFKVMHQVFKTSIDGESGIKLSFTGNFDDRTTINFLKVTDRELHGKFCLCDDKKECANVELESREGKVLAIIDLKTFGIPYEFDLKSNINQELMFDARLIDGNNKEIYKTSSSISPKSQKISLKIHGREFSLQADTKTPDKGLYGYYEERIEFGFDKGEKTKVLWTVNTVPNSFRADWEFIHPQMKTISVSCEIKYSSQNRNIDGRLILNVFDHKDKEITLAFNSDNFNSFRGTITSNGFKIDNKLLLQNIQAPQKEFIILFENGEEKTAMLKLKGGFENLSANAILMNNEVLVITSNIKSGIWKSHITLLDHAYIITLENNEKYKKALIESKGVAELEAIFSPGNKMGIRCSDKGGSIYGGSVSLEKASFLETRSEGSNKNLNDILSTLKKDSSQLFDQLEEKAMHYSKELKIESEKKFELIKSSVPDLTRIQNYYEKKANEILTDVEQDLSSIKTLFNECKDAVIFTVERINKFYTDVYSSLANLFALAGKVFAENIVPAAKTLLKTIEECIEVIFTLICKKLESVNISHYVKAATPWIEPLIELLTNTIRELGLLYQDYEDILKTIPKPNEMFNQVNEFLTEYKLSDQILEFLLSILLQLKSLYPESSEFCEKLQVYIEKKISGEKVDDLQTFAELLRIMKKTTQYNDLSFDNILPGIYFVSLPKTSLSIFKILESFPTLHNLRLTGHVLANGGIISFDGKFSVYNKNCKLVLAQDSIDSNFTVIGNFKNGQLKSISLIDKKSSIEISDSGIAKVNGKNVDWPLISNGMILGSKEWNKFNIKSHDADVDIYCSMGLRNCHITISYLYAGKARGVLGNGNGEQFDDFLLPDGTITDSEEKLFASYGIATCDGWIAPIQSTQKSDCLKLFSWDSSMAAAFSFISPDAYKKACEFIPKCEVASVYTTAAKLRQIPVVLHTECLKCEDKKSFGEEFSVKIPTNKADVVFLIDLDITSDALHDLVIPTISDIQKDLKDRNFLDVNIGIVGYTSKYADAFVVTGNLANIDLNKLKQSTLNSFIPNIYLKADEKAFELAMRYPFRSIASKTIIVIRSDGLVLNFANIGRAVLYSAAAEIRGILLQVVQPIDGLTEDVIGFNNKLVVPLKGSKDAKKRPLLKYTSNVSIENVLQSGGWVFDLNKFYGLSTEIDKKHFVHQLTSTVAENLFRTEITGSCKCLSFDGLNGYSSCLVTKTLNTSKKNKLGVK